MEKSKKTHKTKRDAKRLYDIMKDFSFLYLDVITSTMKEIGEILSLLKP